MNNQRKIEEKNHHLPFEIPNRNVKLDVSGNERKGKWKKEKNVAM